MFPWNKLGHGWSEAHYAGYSIAVIHLFTAFPWKQLRVGTGTGVTGDPLVQGCVPQSQAAHSSGGCPIPASVQGPGLVSSIPGHGRGGTKQSFKSLPTQTSLGCYDGARWGTVAFLWHLSRGSPLQTGGACPRQDQLRH